ncbi:MAG: DNA repair protein RadC [Gammaproteobacteria bacterium]|nr:DNA repair protein RadC [Gammaproteobacteria bacterium]MDD9824497.1 DNA repair protein RadC [Gammaproteobacteria bacterium]MDD9864474.1 DNA repair protein RadC [Gammaproteobacteria bacterium]
MSSIREWPVSERPREKLLRLGTHSLSDAELLAIFLRSGTRGKDAVELGRELLHRFSGLRALMEVPLSELGKVKGLGTAKCVLLRAALELGKRYLHATLAKGDVLDNPSTTKDYVSLHLRGYGHEVFACLFLDNQHRIISFDEMFNGTINSASVHPREVVKRALRHNAAAVILAHNHPSGAAEPSRADELLTQRLQDALKLVDVRVLDHLVVGDGEVTSFAELGML